MGKLTHTQVKAIDEWLKEYKNIERRITLRKFELQENNKRDLNASIKQVNNISNTVESLVLKWDSDPKIKALEHFKNAVIETLKELDEEMKNIFVLRWQSNKRYTWDEIAEKHYISLASVYRRREAIASLFAENIGLFNS